MEVKECKLILYKNQIGGAPTTDIVLDFLNNKTYNKIQAICSDKSEYDFDILDSKINQKTNSKSIYIASGGFSTVIGIKSTSSYFKDELLVLKILPISKSDIKKALAWDKRFFDIYKKNQSKFLAKIYLYGNNIKKYRIIDNTFKNDMLSFNISKYYDNNITNIDIKKQITLKLSSLLYYYNNIRKIYLFDLRYVNISFDTNNIVLIDFDYKLYNSYWNHDENKVKFWKRITIGTFCSIYIKKNFTILFDNIFDKLSYEEIDNIYKEGYSKTYRNAINLYLCRKIEEKLKPARDDYRIHQYDKYNTNYYYTTVKFNPYFDKFNMSSLADIIINLFFDNLHFVSLYNGKNLPPNTQYQENFILNKYIYGNLNSNFIQQVKCFQNLNDIDLLTRLIYKYIQPLPDIKDDTKYIEGLQYLLFNPISEYGLLATDYGFIPPYEVCFKYLKDLNNNTEDKYGLFKRLLEENMGTDDVFKTTTQEYETVLNREFKLSNIGPDVILKLKEIKIGGLGIFEQEITYDNIKYESLELAVLVELLLNRPENKPYSYIMIPPENSTICSTDIYIFDTISREYLKIQKWHTTNFDFDNTIFENTVEYTDALAKIESETYIQVVSEKQEELDLLRVMALDIVKQINPLVFDLRTNPAKKKILSNPEFQELLKSLAFTKEESLTIDKYLSDIGPDFYTEEKSSIRIDILREIKKQNLTQKQINHIDSKLEKLISITEEKNKKEFDDVFKKHIGVGKILSQKLKTVLIVEEEKKITEYFLKKTNMNLEQLPFIIKKILEMKPAFLFSEEIVLKLYEILKPFFFKIDKKYKKESIKIGKNKQISKKEEQRNIRINREIEKQKPKEINKYDEKVKSDTLERKLDKDYNKKREMHIKNARDNKRDQTFVYGDGGYQAKYLKYKLKYLELKNKLITKSYN